MENGKLQKNPPFGSIAYPPKISEPTTLWAVGSVLGILLRSAPKNPSVAPLRTTLQ